MSSVIPDFDFMEKPFEFGRKEQTSNYGVLQPGWGHRAERSFVAPTHNPPRYDFLEKI
jgi:hypothetical protein